MHACETLGTVQVLHQHSGSDPPKHADVILERSITLSIYICFHWCRVSLSYFPPPSRPCQIFLTKPCLSASQIYFRFWSESPEGCEGLDSIWVCTDLTWFLVCLPNPLCNKHDSGIRPHLILQTNFTRDLFGLVSQAAHRLTLILVKMGGLWDYQVILAIQLSDYCFSHQME